MFLSNIYTASNSRGTVLINQLDNNVIGCDLMISADANTRASLTSSTLSIFRRSAGVWTTPVSADVFGGGEGDPHDVSISDDGNVVVVSYDINQYDPPNQSVQGYLPAIRVYRYNGSTYVATDITLSATRQQSRQCRAIVSRDGNYIVASWHEACRCYYYNGSTWTSKGDKPATRQVAGKFCLTSTSVGLLEYNTTTRTTSSPMYVYDLATWTASSSPTKQFSVVVNFLQTNIALSTDGNYAYSASGNQLYTYSTSGLVSQITMPYGTTGQLVRSLDGKYVAVSHDRVSVTDPTLRTLVNYGILIYDITSGVPIDRYTRIPIPVVVAAGDQRHTMAIQNNLLFVQSTDGDKECLLVTV